MKKFMEIFKNPFCIVQKENDLVLYKGTLEKCNLISELPKIDRQGVNYIALLPYCQIKERGFATYDDGEKILYLKIAEAVTIGIDKFNELIPDIEFELTGEISSNLTDNQFKEIARQVIDNEIKNGEGSNFLISRKFMGQIKDFEFSNVLTILRRLMINEIGSYWNFVFYTGEEIFIGASPERHLSIDGETTIMNPICGTLPKSGEGEFAQRLNSFIENEKEINELFQVLDEELKIICKLCPGGGTVIGPHLKEMGTLVHTEYFLKGVGKTDLHWGLKESLFAATMVGSPLQNAARIIKKYEKDSRRYYSSVICTFGRDDNNEDFLDNAITIRTMEINRTGEFVIQSGASIVRDSVPELECIEIKTKAQGLLNALLKSKRKEAILEQYLTPEFKESLNSRNTYLSKFWLETYDKRNLPKNNIKIDLIDNEDDFIYMIKHKLDYMGYKSNVYKYYDYKINDGADIVVIGPGPGNPNDLENGKMKILYSITHELLEKNKKILGVCLGHQILTKALGYKLVKADIPLQGMQKKIQLFGKEEIVGFYNSYFAVDKKVKNSYESKNNIAKDEKDFIYALKNENCMSYQFHVESVLTQNGLELLKDAMNHLLKN